MMHHRENDPAREGVILRRDDVIRWSITLSVLVGASILLFARLGHYALWEGEAVTALTAIGVWRSGDTSAVIDHNVLLYRNGTLLVGLHDRCSMPLPTYLAAPFIGLLGRDAFAARLPFALCGLGSVALILVWLWKDRVDLATWGLWALAIWGNVSFFLYNRQCRYYGLGMFLSVLIGYHYLHRAGRRQGVLLIALLSVALLATNPMNWVAIYAVLAVDYWIWGRREARLESADWRRLLAPQVFAGVPIVAIWNPWKTDLYNFPASRSWWADRLTLLCWNIRDLNAAEFGVGLLLLFALVMAWRDPRGTLGRASLALIVALAVMTAVSPQRVSLTVRADIRYLSPLIPLCMAMGVLTLRALRRGMPRGMIWPLALIAFGTNLLNGGTWLTPENRSTIAEYIGELVRPPGDPYRLTARWINANVPRGCSVWVQPDSMTYPLMFHAPGPLYAWQLEHPKGRFTDLAPIHFRGVVPPDYAVAFGPYTFELEDELWFPRDWKVRYQRIAAIDFYWHDQFRPELYRRTFRPVTGFDPKSEGVYLFKRTTPPVEPNASAAGNSLQTGRR